MKNMKWTAFPVVMALVMSLTGCAENQIPTMTDEQIYEVSEYVAITLMKYDANNRSRLVELDEDDFIEKEPVVTPKPEDSGMKPTDDTPVIDNTPDGESEEPVESVLALSEGLQLTYVGHEVQKTYPEDIAASYFSISAAEGKQLLVLRFDLGNISQNEVSVDLLSSDESFMVTVNEEYSRRALTTMLDNDLSTYVGNLKANESKEVVLIIEVDEALANAITSITIKVQNESKKHTIRVM